MTPIPSVMRTGNMYTSTFTFAKRQYDAEFYALDDVIAQIAKSIPGYLGEETWENQQTGLISNVYYWESMAALQSLMKHPEHMKAKQQQSRWLNGFQVVIAQVTGTYGDNGIQHPLAGRVVSTQSEVDPISRTPYSCPGKPKTRH